MNGRKVTIIFGFLVAGALLGACDRGGDTGSTENGINLTPIAIEKPDLPRPVTRFPSELRTPNVAFNRFVEEVLEACEQGDYDRFCSKFASTSPPPGYEQFKRIWQGVKEITVSHLYSGSLDPKTPVYYVHAVVQLREADPRGRTRRDAVLWASMESDRWRMAVAPQELTAKVLAATTQPVGEGPEVVNNAASAAAPGG